MQQQAGVGLGLKLIFGIFTKRVAMHSLHGNFETENLVLVEYKTVPKGHLQKKINTWKSLWETDPDPPPQMGLGVATVPLAYVGLKTNNCRRNVSRDFG